jgi:hypothetical protein
VDGILSGSLPYTVASSFHPGAGLKPHSNPKTYTQLLQDLEDETYTSDEDGLQEEEEWMRRGSTWKIRKPKNGERSGSTEPERADEEAGEDTALLSGQEREEKRDRIAQIALYGTLSFLSWRPDRTKHALRLSQHGR